MAANTDRSFFLKQFFKPVLLGVIIGALACVAVLLLLAILASSFDLPQITVVPLAMVAAAIAAFLGGFSGGKIAKRNGWLIGIGTALLLYFLSVVAGSALFDHLNLGFMFIKAAIMLATGLLGGILAVNSSTRKRKKR